MSTSFRRGHITVLAAMLLPTILAIAGLAIDASRLLVEHQRMQQVCDAAATAAAGELRMSRGLAAMRKTVDQVVFNENVMEANIQAHAPPTSGRYAGSSQHVEVAIERTIDLVLMPLLGLHSQSTISCRAVAGYQPSPQGVAIVVLDPSPAPLSIVGLPPLIAGLPAALGGFEVLGVGALTVEGAVNVNTNWRGKDESGGTVGEPGPVLAHAISCTPLLGLSSLRAPEVRVVGGVDRLSNYKSHESSAPTPVQANRLPVPDPYAGLLPPTLATDPTNVSSTNHGAVTVASPLLFLAPPVRLSPGVYDWINIVSGRAVLSPGIYIIRSAHPVTGHALLISGLANVEASGVLFYIAGSNNYDVHTGLPDKGAGPLSALPIVGGVVPSAIINLGLGGTQLSGLNAPSSPYHGMAIYQANSDPRPIVIIQESLIGNGDVSGRIYAAQGHLLIAGVGRLRLSAVVGTMRCVNLLSLRISPDHPLPPATDVYLVE